MSGSLAEAVIGAQSSCKLYTNSSGNPASITIHAQATSTSDNACLSIKYSGTDACILCSTTVSTLDAPVHATAGIATTSSAFCGFNYRERACTWDSSYSWCDATDGASYCINCCMGAQQWCTLNSTTGTDASLQPSSDSHFGAGIQCNICRNMRFGGMTQMMQMNYPSFITGSGEVWERQPFAGYYVNCCASSTDGSHAKGGFHRYGQEAACCCIAYCGSRNCKLRHFYCGHICYNACCPPGQCTGCCYAFFSQDIWSDPAPLFVIGGPDCGFMPTSQCQTLQLNFVCNLTDGERVNRSGNRCCADQLYGNAFRAMYREECNCKGCCCSTCFQRITHVSNKYVMAGCDIAFYMSMDMNCGMALIPYPKTTSQTITNTNQESRFCSWNAFCFPGGDSSVCCNFMPAIAFVGSPHVKWLYYNVYKKCNYFEIMGFDDNKCAGAGVLPEPGIYTIDPTYSPQGSNCMHGSCYASCCYQCKCFSEWVDAGYIKKVSGTPTAWCTKTSPHEISTQPQLIAPCCYAIWWSCFDWNDATVTGWNGCMLQYRSPDLVTWEKVGSETITATEQGSGTAICTDLVVNNGADIKFNVNHYFNADNCVNNAGTLEFKVSANRLERTGIVLSNADKLYVNNASSTPMAVQVWGYDD